MSDLLSPTGAEPFNIDPASLSNLVGVQSTLDLTKLEGVLASVVKEMKRANTRISHLEREVEDEKNKSTTAKEEAENLQRSLTATVAELRAQTAKVNKVEEELQTLREEFETEKVENEDSHGKNDARLTGCENRIRELHDAKSEAEEASKKEGATLTARMAMVERSLASKAKEDFVQNLAQDLKAAHQQLKGLEQLAKKVDVDVFNTLRDETKKGISALEERLGDQKAEVDKEIAALNESFEDLKFGEERNGGAAVMEMMNEMEGVRAEMNAMTSRNNNLRSEMTSRVQAVEKDVPELDMRLSTQISDIRRIVDSVGETSAAPTAGGGVDPIALKKLKVELEDVMATREELQQLAEPLHERMERAEGDVREIRRAMTDVKRAVSELRSISNTKDIREKVDNVEKKLDELAKSMTAFASEEEVEEKMNNVKDELSQKLEIGWATDFEQTAAAQGEQTVHAETD
uniref:Uncharacterized protein n=1 Tax=Palpitomonas bilix TaxID=652834 RepID=A0A7S3GLH9_9EUKA|mmetsp:Transcript_8323/g.22138  ORF Transcript_8323/g.22138 Transcript_8323/m.22138 type:complete len:462 (+) Transcript_8323:150-1535(+)